VSESIRRIARRAELLFLLTASPTVNNVPDIWPLLAMCDPRRFGSFWGFVFRFCEVADDGFGLKIGGIADGEAESLDRILKPYVLRRHGLLGLNPSESRIIEHRLEGEQERLYTDMGKTGLCCCGDESVEVLDVLAQVTRLRQLALDPGLLFASYDGPSKLDALPGLVGERPGQVVVFTSFAELAGRAVYGLMAEGVSALALTGDLSDARREEALHAFRVGAAQVLVVTHGTGGEGLNLENADRAIFLDLAWHPAGNEHAMRRILRPGQLSDRTQITYLHSVGTIEDHVRDIVAEKRPVTITEIIQRGGVSSPVEEI
jgi:SNF2 family DNA or RNA helicase